MQQLLSLRVQDVPGALLRIHSLVTAQGWTVRSVAANSATEPGELRMTLALDVDEAVKPKVMPRISKLINVLEVIDLTDSPVRRELVLLRVQAAREELSRVIEHATNHGARIVDQRSHEATLEITGDPQTVNTLLGVMRACATLQEARSGIVAL
jgi:acetolactate synthase I/III small subunit